MLKSTKNLPKLSPLYLHVPELSGFEFRKELMDPISIEMSSMWTKEWVFHSKL